MTCGGPIFRLPLAVRTSAWFAPLPPRHVKAAVAVRVSPGAGMCGTRNVWSTFSELTTTIFGCWAVSPSRMSRKWPGNSSALASRASTKCRRRSSSRSCSKRQARRQAVLRGVIEDWQFDTDSNDPSNCRGVWLHSSDGGIDAACAFIQHLLGRFTPEGHVTLEWSNDCSKPRVDAFGGGAALITARKIKSITTRECLHRQVSRLTKPQPEAAVVV